jgi:putative flippase GtrA
MLKHLRHGAGFIVSGLIAFSTDAAVLWLLTRFAELDPYSARIAAILAAMVAAYFAHRRLTFAVVNPPSASEFLKFASVASTANAINYAIYAGMLLALPGCTPLQALLAASAVAMAVSYLGFRFGVFKKTTP